MSLRTTASALHIASWLYIERQTHLSLPMIEHDFEWNWSERQEAVKAEEDALREIVDGRPGIKLLMAVCKQGFTPEIAQTNTSLEACTPHGIPNLPANLNLYACIMLNPDDQHAMSWKNWLHGVVSPEQLCRLASDALPQIQNRLGPLNFISPALLDDTFNIIESHQPNEAKSLATMALIHLFQPFDDRPDKAEDIPYAPCCAMLLRHAADPCARSEKTGASALSGINAMLTEAEISMSRPSKIKDLLLCAELLLNSGAATDMVRELPPLSTVVPNQKLLGLLCSCDLRNEIKKSLASEVDREAQAVHAPKALVPMKSRRL